jgi:DHA2 family multidrug resistance protein
MMRGFSSGPALNRPEAQRAENTQIVHSRLVEQLRPDNPLAHPPYLAAPFSLTSPSGIAALNAEVTRQAAMVAYIDDFLLMAMIIVACLPLLLLVRVPPAGSRRRSGLATAAPASGVESG